MCILHSATPFCCEVWEYEDWWIISWSSKNWDKDVWKYSWALSNQKIQSEALNWVFIFIKKKKKILKLSTIQTFLSLDKDRWPYNNHQQKWQNIEILTMRECLLDPKYQNELNEKDYWHNSHA